MFRMSTTRRLLVATAVAAVAFLPAAQPAVAGHASTLEKQLRSKINDYREEKGKSTLGWQEKLITKSGSHASEMAEEGRLFHSTTAELTAYAKAGKCDTGLKPIAENIAFGPTLDDIMTGWKKSTEHKATMLKKKWDKIGVGVVTADDGTLWAVTLFCNTK